MNKNLLYFVIILFSFSCDDSLESTPKDEVTHSEYSAIKGNLGNYAQSFLTDFRTDATVEESFNKHFSTVNEISNIRLKSYDPQPEPGEIYIPQSQLFPFPWSNSYSGTIMT